MLPVSNIWHLSKTLTAITKLTKRLLLSYLGQKYSKGYLVYNLIFVAGREPRVLDEPWTLRPLVEVQDLVQVGGEGPVHDLEAGGAHAALVVGQNLTNLLDQQKTGSN